MRLGKAIRLYLRHVIALAGIVVLALAVAAYVTTKERLRLPWDHPERIYAEFSNAQAVTPGQGQTVTVAGVQVGEIGGVRLENGRAVVEMDMDSKELGPVYSNAHLLLRPKTGLNDMSIEMDPGSPQPGLPDRGRLHDGDRIPLENTLPAVNLDEVLSSLDSDTRNYLATVANAGGRGLNGQGPNLRRLIQASQPTFEQTQRIMSVLRARRTEVARLVTNLSRIAHATAGKDTQLANLVESSSAVFQEIASREGDLGTAVDRLPGSLSALDSALVSTRGLAADAGPALARLQPVARQLEPSLTRVRPLLRRGTPLLRDQLRPLVRETTPLVRQLRPSVDAVNQSDPGLIRSANVLNYVANELGFNPPGPEEGYLFWLAWFMHNDDSLLSVQDAQGAVWRGLVMFGCSSAGQLLAANPALAPAANSQVCPGLNKSGAK